MLVISSHDCYRGACDKSASITTYQGVLEYYHYGNQGTNDQGWGCGYRTLQTILSWLLLNTSNKFEMPNLFDIQKILVDIGDKPATFYRSREWIGSVEASMVISSLTEIDCRLVNVPYGKFDTNLIQQIKSHLLSHGSPIMLGGSTDSSSKCILAVKDNSEGAPALLILDPHFYSQRTASDVECLWRDGWLRWYNTESLYETHFYNMCMPLAHTDIKCT